MAPCVELSRIGIWSVNGDLMTTTPNPGPPAPPGGFGNDSRIGAAAPRAPAASKENSRPQAILKFQPRNSFDYRVRYEPQLSIMILNSYSIDLRFCQSYHAIFENCDWIYGYRSLFRIFRSMGASFK